MSKTKRKANISERICNNGRKVYIVSYCLSEKPSIYKPWIDYGVYFHPNDAEIVKELIESGELELMVLNEEP